MPWHEPHYDDLPESAPPSQDAIMRYIRNGVRAVLPSLGLSDKEVLTNANG